MTKNIKSFRSKFRRKLSKYVSMEMTHCGHEGPELLAAQEGARLEAWVVSEVEKYENAAILLSMGRAQ